MHQHLKPFLSSPLPRVFVVCPRGVMTPHRVNNPYPRRMLHSAWHLAVFPPSARTRVRTACCSTDGGQQTGLGLKSCQGWHIFPLTAAGEGPRQGGNMDLCSCSDGVVIPPYIREPGAGQALKQAEVCLNRPNVDLSKYGGTRPA